MAVEATGEEGEWEGMGRISIFHPNAQINAHTCAHMLSVIHIYMHALTSISIVSSSDMALIVLATVGAFKEHI